MNSYAWLFFVLMKQKKIKEPKTFAKCNSMLRENNNQCHFRSNSFNFD